MRGISMSRVRMSGSSARILSRAMKGSGALPTTSISGSPASASVSIFRTMAESSTTNTFVLFLFIRVSFQYPELSTQFLLFPNRANQNRFSVHIDHELRCVKKGL